MAFVLAFRGFRSSGGPERRIRAALATVSLAWLAGQVAWLIQSVVGLSVVPAPADLLTFAAMVAAVVAMDLAVRLAVDRRERLGLYLDAAITFLAVATVVTLAFGYLVSGDDVLGGAFLLSFPIACLSIAGAGLIAALATGARPRDGGLYALLIGTFLYGVAYLQWVAMPRRFSAGHVVELPLLGGCAGDRSRRGHLPGRSNSVRGSTRVRAVLRDALPAAAVALAVACLVIASTTGSANPLVRPLGWAVILTAVLRQVTLVRDRSSAVRAAMGVGPSPVVGRGATPPAHRTDPGGHLHRRTCQYRERAVDDHVHQC